MLVQSGPVIVVELDVDVVEMVLEKDVVDELGAAELIDSVLLPG